MNIPRTKKGKFNAADLTSDELLLIYRIASKFSLVEKPVYTPPQSNFRADVKAYLSQLGLSHIKLN